MCLDSDIQWKQCQWTTYKWQGQAMYKTFGGRQGGLSEPPQTHLPTSVIVHPDLVQPSYLWLVKVCPVAPSHYLQVCLQCMLCLVCYGQGKTDCIFAFGSLPSGCSYHLHLCHLATTGVHQSGHDFCQTTFYSNCSCHDSAAFEICTQNQTNFVEDVTLQNSIFCCFLNQPHPQCIHYQCKKCTLEIQKILLIAIGRVGLLTPQ